MYVFPHEIQRVFLEILLPNSKPTIRGTIYHPPNQSNLLKVQNENINKIDLVNEEIYILGGLNIYLFPNHHIFSKQSMFNSKSIPSDIKSFFEFRTFLVCIN